MKSYSKQTDVYVSERAKVKTMVREKVQKQPVAVGDIIKIATWLLTMAIGAGYFTADEGEQISAIIPAIAGVVAVLVNAGIAYLQYQNVTPWNANNPLVKYPEDTTGR